MTFAWERIKADPGTILATIIVGFVLMSLITGVTQFIITIVSGFGSAASRHVSTSFDAFGPLALALKGVEMIVSDVVWAFIGSGIMVFCLNVARGRPYVFGDVFTGAPYFVSALIAHIVVTIAIVVGMLFLIVPGVILAVGLSMTMPLIVDRRLGPMEAITESWRITTGHKMNLFIFGLLALGVLIVGLCACGIGFFLALPLIFIAQAYIYLRLTGQPVAAIAPAARPGGY
jgi:uncharacterized membrane protein